MAQVFLALVLAEDTMLGQRLTRPLQRVRAPARVGITNEVCIRPNIGIYMLHHTGMPTSPLLRSICHTISISSSRLSKPSLIFSLFGLPSHTASSNYSSS